VKVTVLLEHISGWSTGFVVDTDDSAVALLARLGAEGVIIDRHHSVEFYAPSQIKSLRIDKDVGDAKVAP